MALTKVSTDGVKDDAITSGKIPANAVGASELADNAVDTNAIANNAVTVGKTSGVQTTINNQSDNRMITCTGTSNTLNAEQYLTYSSQSSLNLTDGVGTSNLGGNYLLLKRSTGNTNYLNAPLADADLVISADENLLFHTVHTADFNSTERMRITSDGYVGIGITNPDKTGIQNNVKVLQLDGGDGAEIILGNSVSQNVSSNHIGAIAFKNIDTSTGNAPHYAGIRSNCVDTSGNMNLKFYAGSTDFEADTPHMIIEPNGNTGIGTNNPSYPLDVQVASGDANMRLRTGGTGSGDDTIWRMQVGGTTQDNYIYFGDSADSNVGQIRYNHSSDFMSFTTNATERIRLNSDGLYQANSGNDTAYTLSIAGAVRFQFVHSGGGNMVISNPSSGNVTYSTSSDYRLKENVSSINNALNTVKALKPYQFTWKHDSKIGQGFFAHEVLETVPNSQAAIGTKDAVELEDDDKRGVKKGDPIYQGMDYAKLVPLLTAALQEAVAKIEVLETKVAALEAKS